MSERVTTPLDQTANGRTDFAVIMVIATTIREVALGEMMQLDQYGQIVKGGIGDEALTEKMRKEGLKTMGRGFPRRLVMMVGEGSIEVFINVCCRKDPLIIIGSGNVVEEIYKLAINLNYHLTIIDNYPKTLTRKRFPLAEKLLLGDIITHLQACEITENTRIILASYRHKFDEAALQTVLRTPTQYIGVLGNKHAVTTYFNNLNALGFPEELLEKIHMPVGLNIGGQRTSEIALSIMAEIQALKYRRSGGFMAVKKESPGVLEKREELW